MFSDGVYLSTFSALFLRARIGAAHARFFGRFNNEFGLFLREIEVTFCISNVCVCVLNFKSFQRKKWKFILTTACIRVVYNLIESKIKREVLFVKICTV